MLYAWCDWEWYYVLTLRRLPWSGGRGWGTYTHYAQSCSRSSPLQNFLLWQRRGTWYREGATKTESSYHVIPQSPLLKRTVAPRLPLPTRAIAFFSTYLPLRQCLPLSLLLPGRRLPLSLPVLSWRLPLLLLLFGRGLPITLMLPLPAVMLSLLLLALFLLLGIRSCALLLSLSLRCNLLCHHFFHFND
jgi:hypothetical protein